jgi:hypothetical protein
MLRKPSKKEIIPGNIVDILDGEGNKKGKAKLIRRNPSKYRQDNSQYIKQEDDSRSDDSKCRIWSFERWVVEWVSHDRLKGKTDSVDVHYFVKAAVHTSCGYDPMNVYSTSTGLRFVFIDVEDVIELDGEFCGECVGSLNKLWKSFKKPDIILYYHNQLKAKENLNLYGFKGNLGGFIDPKEHTLEDGIRDFLDINECEDYLILTNQEITIDPERTITTERLTWKR